MIKLSEHQPKSESVRIEEWRWVEGIETLDKAHMSLKAVISLIAMAGHRKDMGDVVTDEFIALLDIISYDIELALTINSELANRNHGQATKKVHGIKIGIDQPTVTPTPLDASLEEISQLTDLGLEALEGRATLVGQNCRQTLEKIHQVRRMRKKEAAWAQWLGH